MSLPLYQMDMTGIDLNEVIAEFETHRLGQEIEGCQMPTPKPPSSATLLNGVVREQLKIDPLIDKQLAEGWRLTRVDFHPARHPPRRGV